MEGTRDGRVGQRAFDFSTPTHKLKKHAHTKTRTHSKKTRQSERTHAIKDAVHAPANELRAPGTEGASALDALLQRAAEEGASEVVVHCALSQVRGPACAAALANRVAASASASAEKEGAQQHPIKISVLHGGFDAWFEEVGARDSLTEEGPGK